jgi:transmembrane sensor
MTDPRPIPRSSALDWATPGGRAEAVIAELRRRDRRRRQRRLALGGAALLVLTASLWWQTAVPTPPDLPARPAVVHQPARRTLPDGSRVELREGARLSIAYSPAIRRVVLEHGEGHFVVEKDPARPFIVVAGGVEVRAVGTAFSVQVGPRDVSVLVTHGRVALDSPAAPERPATPLALLEAGTRAVVAPAAATTGDPRLPPLLQTLNETEIQERLHWRIPRLELSGTRLGEALDLFNRHSPQRLVLADPRLADLQVSGLVRADNTAALLHLLAANYGVVARPAGAGELILERRR